MAFIGKLKALLLCGTYPSQHYPRVNILESVFTDGLEPQMKLFLLNAIGQNIRNKEVERDTNENTLFALFDICVSLFNKL